MAIAIKAEYLAGPSEIAELYGVSKQAVCNWQNRYEDFPDPVRYFGMGPVFDLRKVAKWAKKHGRVLK